MRIIDNKHDFYDYLSSPEDNSIVFDRRKSYTLTKSMVLSNLDSSCWYNDFSYRFILLQNGATFWLYLIHFTEYTQENCYRKVATNYEIELLTTWKNYDKPNELFKLEAVNFFIYKLRNSYKEDLDYNLIIKNIDNFKDCINNNDYNHRNINNYIKVTYSKKGDEKERLPFPLLKSCGIAEVTDPIELFSAIEEYFSIEKQKLERTEPLGSTNNDKIIMHGFDTVTSFRGKKNARRNKKK